MGSCLRVPGSLVNGWVSPKYFKVPWMLTVARGQDGPIIASTIHLLTDYLFYPGSHARYSYCVIFLNPLLSCHQLSHTPAEKNQVDSSKLGRDESQNDKWQIEISNPMFPLIRQFKEWKHFLQVVIAEMELINRPLRVVTLNSSSCS